MALSTAGDAIRAVDLQAFRLRHPDISSGAFSDVGFQNQTEARFLIVALRWLYRACALATELTQDADLLQAVNASWESMGLKQAADMRDVWEHFDEYIVGSGRLQRPGWRPEGVAAPASLGVYTWTGSPDTLGSLSWAGLSLSLDGAVVAAHRLYRQMVATVRG